MRLAIIETSPESYAAILGRTQEAVRQAEIRRPEIIQLTVRDIEQFDWSVVQGCLVGPGCYADLEIIVERLKACGGNISIGAVVENDVYASEGVTLRKRIDTPLMALGDLGQLASFILDCDKQSHIAGGANQRVIGVCHLKGGVGGTTLTAALASCYARHDLSVCVLDFDDVSPQLTSWARVDESHRAMTAEFLHRGEVVGQRLNELLSPVPGFDGKMYVVGQPELYNESFHFKASVIDGAPPSSEFIKSLIPMLQSEFDVVLVDLARSWGLATFATLPMCQHVLLVTDDDAISVRRTFDALTRIKRESDDSNEFDFSRWSFVLNSYSGTLISPKDLAEEISALRILDQDARLFTIPFCKSGRQWGMPGETFYDTADTPAKKAIRKLASALMPFNHSDAPDSVGQMVKKKLGALISL